MVEKKRFLFVETGPDDTDRDRHPQASEWKIVDGGALVVTPPTGSSTAYSPTGWRSLYTADWDPPTRY